VDSPGLRAVLISFAFAAGDGFDSFDKLDTQNSTSVFASRQKLPSKGELLRTERRCGELTSTRTVLFCRSQGRSHMLRVSSVNVARRDHTRLLTL